MQNLKQILTRPLLALPNKLVVTVLLVALIGFADAAYLTVEHYKNVIPPCSIGGCEVVLTSAYSTVFGLPVSLVGAVFYLLIAASAFAYLEGKHEKVFRLGLALTVLGFLTSVFFFIIQAFVLHAFCYYCLGSAGTSTLLFILAWYVFATYSSRNLLTYSHE